MIKILFIILVNKYICICVSLSITRNNGITRSASAQRRKDDGFDARPKARHS